MIKKAKFTDTFETIKPNTYSLEHFQFKPYVTWTKKEISVPQVKINSKIQTHSSHLCQCPKRNYLFQCFNLLPMSGGGGVNHEDINYQTWHVYSQLKEELKPMSPL